MTGVQTCALPICATARAAEVVAVDEVADQAALRVAEPLGVEPLVVARRLPIPGSVLYFLGNPTRPELQSVRLDRIGNCPSLPNLHDALFTSLRGQPGDSGAPLVDGAARVVGLVHGGAQCQIATPCDRLWALVNLALERQMARGPTSRPPTSTAWRARRWSASSGRSRPRTGPAW